MLRPIDEYFQLHEEPVKGCLQFLRQHILRQNNAIAETWKYKMPFYTMEGKMFCYLWVHKKLKQPYIGFVKGKQLNHPDLITEKRAKMKILLIEPAKNLPLKKITAVLKMAVDLYK